MFPFELPANQCQLICPLGLLGRHCLAGNSKGNTMTDAFLADSNFFYTIANIERGFVYGTFVLGWKNQGRTVMRNFQKSIGIRMKWKKLCQYCSQTYIFQNEKKTKEHLQKFVHKFVQKMFYLRSLDTDRSELQLTWILTKTTPSPPIHL